MLFSLTVLFTQTKATFAAVAPPSESATTGTLIIVKTVINDDSGTAVSSDFTIQVDHSSGETTSTSNVTGDASGTPVILTAGTYSVYESPISGYTASYSSDCTGSIAAGETKTCTVTNDDDSAPPAATTGTLIIIKTVINDDGGTSVAEDFKLSLISESEGVTTTLGLAGNASGTEFSLNPGTYDVTEGDYKGYTTTYSEECSGSIATGETKTCTVTNNDINLTSGTLIVIKIVDNSYGNNKKSSDFTMHVDYTNNDGEDEDDGNGDENPNYISASISELIPATATTTISFPGDDMGTILTIGLGNYSVYEDVLPLYTPKYSEDCIGTMTAGETKTCTVINRDSPYGMGSNDPYINDRNNSGSEPENEIIPEEPNEEPNNNDEETSSTPTEPTPRVLGAEDATPTLYSCTITESEALFITSEVNDILFHLNATRNTEMENKFNSQLTPKVTTADLDNAILSAIENFINYGTKSTQELGQGERAGVIDSFTAIYGHVPQDACDWQNVLKIASTKMPDTLNLERERQMEQTFFTIYNRNSNRSVAKDDIAIKLMSYGIRPQIRNIEAEYAAASAFESIFGHKPADATEWDINRAMTYSGLSHPLLPAYLETAISRISQIN